MIRSVLLCLCLASPATAGVKEAVEDHIRPGFETFAIQTRALAVNAEADCSAEALRPSYQNAFDAWMRVAHISFGPVEEAGRNLAIAFWPDKRGMVAATVAQLVAEEDDVVASEAGFAEVSVAGRGFFALEHLLYDAGYEGYARDSYTCRLVQAVSADLARMAGALTAEWGPYGELMLSAGSEGNAVFLTDKEAAQKLYTALMGGLEWTADQRLGRPMGTFDRPRPERAEARRSGRSLRNVILSTEALRDLAEMLSDGDIPVTEEAFDTALAAAEDLQDPVFQGVTDPSGRLKVEIVQQRIRAVRDAINGEIGPQLGVGTGFNSADGD
ncbi:imelysin family protein [Pseudooceanicola sp. C21-150M6]|uniref:imelysin family protein n=1 Tax=Pseudooceanicola sp. C21-150M6 TaxID=3434355 RepID=UPI003D7FC716